MEKKLTVPEEAEQRAPEAIGFKPLYAQVRERLMRRLVDGEWSPGMLLPSEIELARQLSVSQGTVRKALDSMTADNLLLRRQGRGTYVAEPEESRILFQFFRLSPDIGSPSFPDSKVLSTGHAKPTRTETESLKLGDEDQVFRNRTHPLARRSADPDRKRSRCRPGGFRISIISPSSPTISTGSIPSAGASPSAAPRKGSRRSPRVQGTLPSLVATFTSRCC